MSILRDAAFESLVVKPRVQNKNDMVGKMHLMALSCLVYLRPRAICRDDVMEYN
jgi:hypothetical protein